MGKRLFWIFILMVSVITTGAVIYIQSESFGKFAKQHIQKKVRKLGLELNFDRLRVGVLPPSLSMVNVDLIVHDKDNVLGLTTDTVFKAERLGFSFRMIQAFSSGIEVNKIFLSDASVRLKIPKKKQSAPSEKLSELVHKPIRIDLGDSFFASVRQIEIKNTLLDLSWEEAKGNSRVRIEKINYFAVTPSQEGTNAVVNLEEISVNSPSLTETLRAVKANADIRKDLIELYALDVQRRQAALHAQGRLLGSIDNIEESRPDIDVILRAPLEELSDYEKAFKNFGGELTADAKVVGRIRDPEVQGRVEIANFKYSLWAFDKLEFNGSFGEGALVLDSLLASAAGGKISLKNKLELPIPFQPTPSSFQLRFNAVKFEDFAGDIKKSVNNLKLQVDGTANVRLDFATNAGKSTLNSVSLRTDLSVRNLELNNQTFGKSRPYQRIFGASPFQMVSNIAWKQKALHISDSKLIFNTGSLDVSGKVSDAGFDIVGVSEKVNLERELGDISGIPIAGEGAFRIHVNGPMDAVKIDFDVRQKGARFVNFNFGEVNGRVTYDDKNSYIYISDIKGKKNSASYSVNGKVNIGEGDDISLAAVFGQSDPNDLFDIFEKQLEKLTWIPRGMTGALEGSVKVGGGYSKGLSSLEIDGRVRGKNLSYKGEMIHEAEAIAGLSKGIIFAREVRAKKYETDIKGAITYNLENDHMEYSLEAPKGKLRSLDIFSATGIPVDGLFHFRSEGKGKWETLESVSTFDVTNAYARTRPVPPLTLKYETHATRSNLSVNLGADAQFTASIANDSGGDSSGNLQINDARLEYLLCIVNKSSCLDPTLSFSLSADAKMNWKGSAWDRLNGSGEIRNISLQKAAFGLKNGAPVIVRAHDGLVEFSNSLLEGEETKLGVRSKLRLDGSLVDTNLTGFASLKVLEFITPLVEEARGRMRMDVGLNGTTSDANFRGTMSVENGFLRLSGLEAPVDSFSTKIRLNSSRLAIESFQGQLGSGTLQITGGMDLFLNKAPRMGFDLFLANNRLKFFPVNYAEISDAKLSFTGEALPYLFSGTARVKKVMMRNNFDLSNGQKALQNARYLPEKVGGAKPFYEVKIRGIAENNVIVQNNLFDAEFRGELTLLNNFEFPQVVGRAELVRGKLLIRNSVFTLDHALIRLPNPDFFNPQFSLGGSTDVDNYRISIFAGGTIDRHKITFSSNPVLPQEDIISLLAFGYRGEDARTLRPADKTAITYSEFGSILLEQLQLSQNLQQKGVKVNFSPSVNDNEAAIIRPNPNDSPGSAAPKVNVRTQVLKNLEAAFGATVGSTQGQSVDAKLEYRLNKKASVQGVYEKSPALDATETRNSYGADLKFRWGFK